MKTTATIFWLVVLGVGTLAAQTDTIAPQLVDLTINPTVVDVTLSSQTVTFFLHITDDLSGIDTTSSSRIAVQLRSPSGSQSQIGFVSPQAGVLRDVTLPIPVSIPRFSEAGAWTISSIRLRDNVGNTVSLSTAALAAAEFPTVLNVMDSTPDSEAPQLTSVSFAPSSVNVSGGPVNIIVDLAITDNVSGVSQQLITGQDFNVTSPSGRQLRLLAFSTAEFVRISGTDTNGIWRATLVMPQYSEPGVWKLSSLILRDQTHNSQVYSPSALAAFGSSIEVSVTSSPADTTPPALSELTFTPSFINSSLGPQSVHVAISATDDLSGVSFARDTPIVATFSSFPSFGTFLRSPSGAQSVSTPFLFLTSPPLLTGNPQNGTWHFDVTFPQFSEAGTWQASVSLKDATRNVSSYTSSQLVSGGFSSQLVVIQPSLVPDGTISNPAAGGSISDNTFGDRAKVVVPPSVLSQATTIAIDVLQSPLQVPLPVGFSGAETYFVNIEFLPPPTFPLPPPGLTVILPLRNYTIPGTGINLFRIDPATGNLVQALNTSGNPVVGNVDIGGLTATFSGVSRLSTVVGLLQTAVPVQIAVHRHSINTKSHGNIPVVIFSSPELDATKIDPATLRFAGASVEIRGRRSFQISTPDADGDGLPDLLAHFKTEELLLTRADTQGVLEGRTYDNRLIRGVAPVKILK